MQADLLLQKYGSIIAEEVNVKEVGLLDKRVVVRITYVPLGQKIWWLFGKDTNIIITAAKNGQATYHADGTLSVYEGDESRLLQPDMYEIRYSGLEEDHQTVEWGVIVSLDLTITEDLKKEWVAREISRFLNQMRKDADLLLDKKVSCIFATTSEYLQEVISTHSALLQEEALLTTIQKDVWYVDHELFRATFVSEEWSVLFIFS